MELITNGYDGDKKFIKSMGPKKYGLYKLTRYSEWERRVNLQERFNNELNFHNNCYQQTINTKYSYLFSLKRAEHSEMVVGYLVYKQHIIPYTEAMGLHTIYSVLSNDARFEFAGDKHDLNYKHLICFLISVGLLFPKDETGELLFEVVSIFNGCYSSSNLIEYTKLTHLITGKTTHYGDNPYGFDFTDITEFNVNNVIKPTSQQQNKIILKSQTIKDALR